MFGAIASSLNEFTVVRIHREPVEFTIAGIGIEQFTGCQMVVKRDHRLQLKLQLPGNLRGSLGEVRVHALTRPSGQGDCRNCGGRDREQCKYPYQLRAQRQIAQPCLDVHSRAAKGIVGAVV